MKIVSFMSRFLNVIPVMLKSQFEDYAINLPDNTNGSVQREQYYRSKMKYLGKNFNCMKGVVIRGCDNIEMAVAGPWREREKGSANGSLKFSSIVNVAYLLERENMQ